MYKRLLIPSDGTPGPVTAEDAVIALARSMGASVVGFAVGSLSSSSRHPLFSRDTTLWSDERRSTDQRLEDLLHRMRVKAERAGVPFSGHAVLSDRPASEIADAAVRNGCDLIYMGTRGRGRVRTLFQPSVAMEVVSLAQVPVTLLTRAMVARGPARP